MIMTEETKKVGRECLGFRARMLSRVITTVYDDALSEVGLKVSQFSVLTAIANREETRPAELAKVRKPQRRAHVCEGLASIGTKRR